MIKDKSLPYNQRTDKKDDDQSHQQVIQNVFHHGILSQCRIGEDIIEEPNDQCSNGCDQSCDENFPQQVNEIDAFGFCYLDPEIEKCTDNEQHEENPRHNRRKINIHFVTLYQQQIDIEQRKEQPKYDSSKEAKP